MNVSVVIPYRSDNGWRDRLFYWNYRRYKALLPEDCDVVLATESKLHPFFCRSEAINNGVRDAKHDLLLIADADAVFYPDALRMAAIALNEGSAQWVIPYDRYLELHEDVTETILRHCFVDSDPRVWVPEGHYDVYTDSNASLVLVTRAAFESVGGFDERFVGWAPEDQAWAAAMTTMCGAPKRITLRDMVHLWHPVDRSKTSGNPHFEESVQLWAKYKAASGNRAEMERLLQR